MKKFFLSFAFVAICAASLQASTQGQLRQGGKLYNHEKYGSALNIYHNILKKDPNNQPTLFNAGNAYYRLNEYTQAEDFYKKAAKLDGNYGQSALYNLGNAYYKAGDTEKAKNAYIQALLKDPQDKEAAHNLQLLIKQNQQNQNNQNDQNQDNQDNQSDNQNDQQNQDQNKGQQPQNQPEQKQSGQLNKQDADRVMSMAKENEFKSSLSSGDAGEQTIEKDW